MDTSASFQTHTTRPVASPSHLREACLSTNAITPVTLPSSTDGVNQADIQTAARSALQQVLAQSGIAPSVLQKLIDTLWHCAQVQTYEAGDLILDRLQSADDLVLLVHGAAARGLAKDSTDFQQEHTVQAPAWLDVASAWLPGHYLRDAKALSAVMLLRLKQSQVETSLGQTPAWARHLVQALAGEVRQLTTTTQGLMHKDALARLAGWLQEHSLVSTPAPGRMRVELTQRKRDIAAQLAITPETLSRLLRQLSRLGLIDVRGYQVDVLNPEGLAALSRG